MVKKVQVLLIDDLDGGTAEETVVFGLDGDRYEIDLSKSNAATLRDTLAGYVAHARKAGRSSADRQSTARSSGRTAHAPIDRDQAAAIRTWARKKGHDVSDRGRIPARIVDLYNTVR